MYGERFMEHILYASGINLCIMTVLFLCEGILNNLHIWNINGPSNFMGFVELFSNCLLICLIKGKCIYESQGNINGEISNFDI